MTKPLQHMVDDVSLLRLILQQQHNNELNI